MTTVFLKEGEIDKLGATLDGLKTEFDVLTALKGIYVIRAGEDKPNAMIDLSVWDNKEGHDANEAAVGAILGKVKEVFSAPPERDMGAAEWSIENASTATKPFVRITTVTLKEGEIDKIAATLHGLKTDFDALTTLKGIYMVKGGADKPDTMFAVSLWDNKEGYDANEAAVGAILGKVKEIFAGPPTRVMGEPEWAM